MLFPVGSAYNVFQRVDFTQRAKLLQLYLENLLQGSPIIRSGVEPTGACRSCRSSGECEGCGGEKETRDTDFRVLVVLGAKPLKGRTLALVVCSGSLMPILATNSSSDSWNRSTVYGGGDRSEQNQVAFPSLRHSGRDEIYLDPCLSGTFYRSRLRNLGISHIIEVKTKSNQI